MSKRATILCLLILHSILFFSENSKTISLAGKWNFAIDQDGVGINESWFKRILTDDIYLPGSMTENGKGFDISLSTKFTGSIYDSSWYFNPKMEKYRKLDNLKMPFWLTQSKHYVGQAWYQKTVDIPSAWKSGTIQLFLEHPHFTTHVWIDDTAVGTYNSLTVPHVFDLTNLLKPGKHRITICVDNRMKDVDVGANSHSVTDHTQGNWNGIVGKMLLIARPSIFFDDIQVFPDLKLKKAVVKLKIASCSEKVQNCRIELSARSFNSTSSHIVPAQSKSLSVATGQTEVSIELPMGDDMLIWDEFSPSLYKLSARLVYDRVEDIRSVDFGMREITISGKWFYINGRKTMMRGTVENALFPLTGYPPMDLASWERVFRVCKSFGLNHMRFHSYCPPEAAFEAADLTGFYLQPEGPSWPNHSTQLGRGLPIDKYLMEETQRMTKEYGNHPSFTMMACGNEPRGAWVSWVNKFVDYWKATDNRRVYTGASVGQSWAWQPKSQYHVKAGARGLNWSNTRPESLTDYRNRIDSIKEPYISHETGQWCAFPDFDEIKKYTGVAKAKNFELFKEDLADNDLGDMAHEFLMASGHLQALCYKHEIERTLRTPDYAGFQLLSLNDYSGQGTALVGVLDALWDEKGYISAAEFKRFCNAVVPLIRMDRFVFRESDTLKAKVEIANFSKSVMPDSKIGWRIKDAYGAVLQQGIVSEVDLPIGNNIEVGQLHLPLNRFRSPSKLNLELFVSGTEYHNNWNFWVYPDLQKAVQSDVYVCDSLDGRATRIIEAGGKVLILAAGKVKYGKDVVQYFTPVFWNTSWFKMRPPHTTGVYVNNYHPVFKEFVTENWADMQWWELVNRTQCMLLSDFPKGFRPIVQPIDTWFINRKLGLLFEVNVGKAKVMVTSIDFKSDLKGRPVAESLYKSILDYMNSSEFKPEFSVASDRVRDLFTKVAPAINSYTKSSPDELKKDVK